MPLLVLGSAAAVAVVILVWREWTVQGPERLRRLRELKQQGKIDRKM